MKGSRRALALLLAALAGLIALSAGRTSMPLEDASRRTLRAVAYNTHLLPGIALAVAGRRGQGKYRAGAIGRRVAEYDLIGLCEVFDDKLRSELIASVQAASSNAFTPLWFPKPRGRSLANSGLLLLSRLPIEESHWLTYRDASRFITHGFRADGFAAKGVIHTRLRLSAADPEAIDCFLTHLESRSAAVRRRQLEELARFIAAHADGERPALVMGDLNVAADFPAVPAEQAPASEYQALLSALRSSGVDWIDVWPSLHAEAGGTSDPLGEAGGRRIDYVFVSCGRAAGCSLRVTRASVEPFLDAEVSEGSLSDHAGVACEIEIDIREGGELPLK